MADGQRNGITTTFRKSVNILLHFFRKVNTHYPNRQRKTLVKPVKNPLGGLWDNGSIKTI
nr:MAG TPA: hypothetical protein [Caudoviricetes sp.]